MDFRSYLKTMVEKDASDLYLSCGAPASAKIHGTLTPLEAASLTPEQVKHIACSVMNADQASDFERRPEISMDEALKNADSPNNLRLNLSLNSEQQDRKGTASGLSLIDKEEQDAENETLQAEG